MINPATGDVDFRSGLHIAPHCSVQSLVANAIIQPSIVTQKLSLTDWNRHILGIHISEHGTFEVEALSAGGDRIQVVLLSHRHGFYEPGTPDDADRRTFHEGLINTDLCRPAGIFVGRSPLPAGAGGQQGLAGRGLQP